MQLTWRSSILNEKMNSPSYCRKSQKFRFLIYRINYIFFIKIHLVYKNTFLKMLFFCSFLTNVVQRSSDMRRMFPTTPIPCYSTKKYKIFRFTSTVQPVLTDAKNCYRNPTSPTLQYGWKKWGWTENEYRVGTLFLCYYRCYRTYEGSM
jgi:hypothetical protein